MRLALHRFIMAAAAMAMLLALAPEARAACVPKTGRRGTFPHHGDAEIPASSRFLFEIASWPDKPTVTFKLQYGSMDIPGDFHFLEAVGPEGQPHSQFLYEFVPTNAIPGADQPYHYFLTYRLAGSTKDETHSAVFSVALGADTTPPTFGGLEDVTYIFGTPDSTTMDSGYDCILDEGTFTIARVRFPTSEVRKIGEYERRDGVIFTAYEASEDGQVSKKVLSRSTIWPAEYTNVPDEWLFVVEKNPAPDTKRCYAVRASDATGNEDGNTRVKCIVTPGPATLPPGAGGPGFFGGSTTPSSCGVAPTTPGGLTCAAALTALLGLGAARRRRRA